MRLLRVFLCILLAAALFSSCAAQQTLKEEETTRAPISENDLAFTDAALLVGSVALGQTLSAVKAQLREGAELTQLHYTKPRDTQEFELRNTADQTANQLHAWLAFEKYKPDGGVYDDNDMPLRSVAMHRRGAAASRGVKVADARHKAEQGYGYHYQEIASGVREYKGDLVYELPGGQLIFRLSNGDAINAITLQTVDFDEQADGNYRKYLAAGGKEETAIDPVQALKDYNATTRRPPELTIVRHPCTNGEDGLQTCTACNGTGYKRVAIGAESPYCPTCKSAGRVYCYRCAGQGYLDVPEYR